MACDLAEARLCLRQRICSLRGRSTEMPAPFSLDFDSTIRSMIDSGQLGQLLEVRVVHTGGHLANPEAPITWRQDRSLSDKNILTMGIMHEIILRWIQEEPAWVLADGAVFHSQRCYADEVVPHTVELPESLSVVGRFSETGARMIYHFSGVESGKPRMEFRLNGSRVPCALMPFRSNCFCGSWILARTQNNAFAGAQPGLAGRSRFCGFNPFGQAGGIDFF